MHGLDQEWLASSYWLWSSFRRRHVYHWPSRMVLKTLLVLVFVLLGGSPALQVRAATRQISCMRVAASVDKAPLCPVTRRLMWRLCCCLCGPRGSPSSPHFGTCIAAVPATA